MRLSLMDCQQHEISQAPMTEDPCGSRHPQAVRVSAVIEDQRLHRQTEQINRAWRVQCGALHCETGREHQVRIKGDD